MNDKFRKDLVGQPDIQGVTITEERAQELWDRLQTSSNELNECGNWNIPNKMKKGIEYNIWGKRDK